MIPLIQNSKSGKTNNRVIKALQWLPWVVLVVMVLTGKEHQEFFRVM